MTDPERIREACNAENNPELPEGCMYPWCVCNRYPEGTMTRRIDEHDAPRCDPWRVK